MRMRRRCICVSETATGLRAELIGAAALPLELLGPATTALGAGVTDCTTPVPAR